MKLFVDDTREFPEHGYECCRDAETAMLLLSVLPFDYISLDYSLGMNCKNGLDLLMWIKEHRIVIPHINIHSNHVIGRERMYLYCKDNFPNTKVTMVMLPK